LSISERKKSDRRKKLKEMLKALDNVFNAIKDGAESGEVPRDQQLRFLKDYPSIRQEYEGLVAESLKEETGLPEGKLRQFIDKLEELQKIGPRDQVIEAAGYYRCDNCNELHENGRDCMYEEYKKFVDKENAKLNLLDPSQIDINIEGPKDNEDKGDKEGNEI